MDSRCRAGEDGEQPLVLNLTLISVLLRWECPWLCQETHEDPRAWHRHIVHRCLVNDNQYAKYFTPDPNRSWRCQILPLQLQEGDEVCRSIFPFLLSSTLSSCLVHSSSQMGELRLIKDVTCHQLYGYQMAEPGSNLELPDSKARGLSSGSLFLSWWQFLIPIPQLSKQRLQKRKPVVPERTVGQQVSQDWSLSLYDKGPSGP